VLTTVPLAAAKGFSVDTVTCRSDHTRWSAPEVSARHILVLVRRGRFRRQGDGADADLDRTMAYVTKPGVEQRFAHPDGGDVCTSVAFSPDLWEQPVATGAVYVDARAEFAHRRLLAATRKGDVDYEVVEEVLRLIATAAGNGTTATRTPKAADRMLVAAAREAILEDAPEAANLPSLAAGLGVSPYRLSRTFSAQMAVSVTWYRNRVRVGRALERIAGGDERLADLAVELGFADQAHLTRTVRDHVGQTPAVARRLMRTE
jgi:AraC-like DNA-binding protein